MPTKITSQDSVGNTPDKSRGETGTCTRTLRRKHKHDKDKDKDKPRRTMPLEECRRMYKQEMHVLWSEVEEFRKSCREQMEKQSTLLREHTRKHKRSSEEQPGTVNNVTDIPEDFTAELRKLEKNMNYLERNQGVLDQERDLVEKEELLDKRQQQLREVEKEVEEAEAMLNKRQSICDKRTKTVEHLNDDLLHMKNDFIEAVETMESHTAGGSRGYDAYPSAAVNSPEASAKARRHWTIARRHLVDKVSLLEATVQRYRTELASASAYVTAKDLMIARLNTKISDVQEDSRNKQCRIKQLENQLSITTQEKMRSEKNFEMLLEELQNIDLGASHKLYHSPEHSPKHNGSVKNKHSTFSIFGSESDYKGTPTRERSRSAASFKDHFKRKILNMHSASSNATPKRRGNNSAESNGVCNTSHAEESDTTDCVEDIPGNSGDTSPNKRALKGHTHRNSSSSDSGSKACNVM